MTLTADSLLSRCVSYMMFLREHVVHRDPSRVVLMDETAVYFEDPRRNTIDVTGSRHVILKSTGYDSMRVTAVLAVSADGTRLPPVVIGKGKYKQ